MSSIVSEPYLLCLGTLAWRMVTQTWTSRAGPGQGIEKAWTREEFREERADVGTGDAYRNPGHELRREVRHDLSMLSQDSGCGLTRHGGSEGQKPSHEKSQEVEIPQVEAMGMTGSRAVSRGKEDKGDRNSRYLFLGFF